MSRLHLHPAARARTLLALSLPAVLVAVTALVAPVAAMAGVTGPSISPSLYPTAYVGAGGLDTGVVTPINTASNTRGTPIDVGCGELSCGGNVYAVAVSPNGGTAYAVVGPVGDSGDGTVYPVNLTTGAVGAGIGVGLVADDPTAIAITPNGATAFVANSGDNVPVSHAPGAIDTVTPINLVTGTAGTPITVGDNPDAIAITPDGTTAYVANSGGDTVTPINVSTDEPGTPITVGSGPSAIAITPDGSTAYVANNNDNTVTPIDLATGTPGPAIPVGTYPDGIAITPDGSTAYVANYGGTVTPIDLATNTAQAPISLPGSAWPVAIAASPNGSAVYVVDWYDSAIIPISTATDTAGSPISAGGDEPFSIGFAPGWQAQATVPSASTGSSPSLCQYDGAMYAAFTTSAGGIGYAVNSGSGWGPVRQVGGSWGSPDTSWSPALVADGGQLQAYWTNAANNQVKYSTLSGGAWSAPGTVSGSWGTAQTNAGPAVAVSGSLLAVGWKGESSGDLWYTTFTGSGWSAQVNTGQVTSYAPAIAPLPSGGVPLAFAWTEPSGSVGYGDLSILGFESEGTVPQAGTNAAPALAFAGSSTDGTLYLGWKGKTNDDIGYSAIFNVAESGLAPANWTAQEFEPQAETLNTPVLAADGYVLYAGWTGKTTSYLFYASAENPY